MAREEHYYTRFEEGNFYHIYNRSIDKKLLFKSDANYLYFMKKFSIYLNDVIEVYAYSLLDNHFHFLIRIMEDLTNYKISHKIDLNTATHTIVSKHFRVFFQSYALSFNKQQKRCGTLFQTPFKRALVTSDSYLTQLIYYIHSNPQKHKLIKDFRNWKWSSYRGILSDKPSHLKRKEVYDWFGGKKEFINFHENGKFILSEKHIME